MARARAALGSAFDALSFVEETETGAAQVLEARAADAGDVVLARKDVGVAYHLAVVVDDALQAITHVIRGEDLRRPPASSDCCRRCLTCPSPAIDTTPCCWTPQAAATPSVTAPRPSTRSAPAG
jgi:glutamyl-Q tRNA(Asp) synthetase